MGPPTLKSASRLRPSSPNTNARVSPVSLHSLANETNHGTSIPSSQIIAHSTPRRVKPVRVMPVYDWQAISRSAALFTP